MIGVLVGDQNCINAMEVLPNRRQPLAQFPHAESGVYEDARTFGRKEGRVTAAATGQSAEFYDRRLLP
jgi:hypothetical protein